VELLIVDGLPLVDLVAVLIAKTMDLQVSNSVAVDLEGIADGPPLVVHEAVQIARMMDLQATINAVVAMGQLQAPVVEVQQVPPDIGTAVEAHVEESGRVLAQILAVNFLGAHLNACLIMQLPEPLVIPPGQQSLQQQVLVIPSGRMVLAVASASCSLLQPAEK
jgi:hypothetical protein